MKTLLPWLFLLSWQIDSAKSYVVRQNELSCHSRLGRATRKMVTSYNTDSNNGTSDDDSDSDLSYNQFWKKDHTMSTIMSASFVAKDWIQSLPCALRIADCDMPEKSKLPATAKGAGLDQIDTVNFLNIKRVKSIKAPSSRPTAAPSTVRALQNVQVDVDVDADADENDVLPSWQDIWRKDNVMSTMMSASFIANDWIQSLPCALGIADCEMPEKAKLPATAKGSGMEKVDVLHFLNIKRVKPLEKRKKSFSIQSGTVEQFETFSWQEIWKKDNVMSTMMSASFIPKEWIKSLPNTPETNLPTTAKGSGLDKPDVSKASRRLKEYDL